MPSTICNIGDELIRVALGVAKSLIYGLNQQAYEVDIAPLVEASDIISVGYLALVEDKVYGTSMVYDIEPVTHVLSRTVDRKGTTQDNILNEEGDKLLGILVRSVVVGTVGDDRRQTIGIMEGSHEVITRGLTSRIGTMWVILRLLGEESSIEL